MEYLKTWLITRLKEQSTWIGLTTLLAGVGVSFSPELTEQIVTTGVALAGLIYTFFPESGKIEGKDDKPEGDKE